MTNPREALFSRIRNALQRGELSMTEKEALDERMRRPAIHRALPFQSVHALTYHENNPLCVVRLGLFRQETSPLPNAGASRNVHTGQTREA